MNSLSYILPVVFIQLSSAQLVTYGVQNGQSLVQNYNTNQPRTFAVQNNGINLQNTAVAGVQNIGLPSSNIQLGQAIPTGSVSANLVGNNLANTNYLTTGLGNANLLPNNLGTNLIANGNLVPSNANLIGNNIGTVGGNFVGANLVNANTFGQPNFIAAPLPVNLANGYNLNTGSFAISNTGLAQLLNLPCGIQIVADALEIGGTFGVTGQLPFYATVTANGQLPSSGYGYATCGCGGQ
ncbi:unnamed protein product [Diatraea saccharalis]|uniref:Uncharacterized protein n=1 Tax=Diatraea saccharalis TaxID=40085 RepID=A0A9N9WJJ3_9NEOP|nr:unnamed protein product [Diatraea saccharalis]